MNHEQAIQEMATERYLLDELTPELRDAFEEHMFECTECALDVRAGNVFMTEAKVQLPQLAAEAAPARPVVREKKPWWSFLTVPAFAAPVFAALLAVVVFQNVSTIPSLRQAATEPRIMPWSSLHADTRGAEAITVQADRNHGAMVMIDIPQGYASFEVGLTDPQGKRTWTKTISASDASISPSGAFPLFIPGAWLKDGSYTLNLAGISPQGARTELGRRVLEVHLND
jgi:Putative zinc-finger